MNFCTISVDSRLALALSRLISPHLSRPVLVQNDDADNVFSSVGHDQCRGSFARKLAAKLADACSPEMNPISETLTGSARNFRIV
jgi:hypothetical protein